MSLPELFYHENLFVGCLSLRRIMRHKVNDVIGMGELRFQVSIDDAQLMADMADSQLFNFARSEKSADYYFSIMTQAMDYESLNSCPALGADHSCAIHHNRKPAVCSMVPFDSLYPESLQNIVLLSRQYGENCIVTGQLDDYAVVVKNRQVVDEQYRDILKQRRDDLGLEKRYWGNAVFSALQHEFFSNPSEIAKIPIDNGLLLLSIIPVLMIIANVSDKCRARCLQYVDSQINLIDSKINLAILRKSAVDKKTTSEFRLFKSKYMQFRAILLDSNPSKRSLLGDQEEKWISDVENYLFPTAVSSGVIFNEN